jgi:TolA-binding protein
MNFLKHIGLLVLLCFGVSCSNSVETPPPSLADRVALVEARHAANPSAESLQELLSIYAEQAADTSASSTTRLNRIRYIAEATYASGKHDSAYHLLRQGIADFPHAASVLDASLFLAEIAIQRRQEPKTAELIFATLRDRFAGHPGLKKIPADYEVVRLSDLQTQMQKDIYPPSGFNREAAIDYGKASWAFTAIAKDTAVILRDHFASGTVLEQAKNYPLAMQHYDEVLRRFPQHSRAGDALMVQAVLLSEVYEKKDQARQKVEALMQRFPDHPMLEDARALLTELQ